MQLTDARFGKNQGNESSAKSEAQEGRDISFKVIGFKNGKKIGSLKDHTGKVMVFATRKEAETAVGIESMQIENIGIDCRIVRVKTKTGEK